MNYIENRINSPLTFFVLILIIFSDYGASLAQDAGLSQDAGPSKVIFYVK